LSALSGKIEKKSNNKIYPENQLIKKYREKGNQHVRDKINPLDSEKTTKIIQARSSYQIMINNLNKHLKAGKITNDIAEHILKEIYKDYKLAIKGELSLSDFANKYIKL